MCLTRPLPEQLFADRVDLERVRRIVSEFAEAIEEPDRVAAFDHILKRLSEKG